MLLGQYKLVHKFLNILCFMYLKSPLYWLSSPLVSETLSHCSSYPISMITGPLSLSLASLLRYTFKTLAMCFFHSFLLDIIKSSSPDLPRLVSCTFVSAVICQRFLFGHPVTSLKIPFLK